MLRQPNHKLQRAEIDTLVDAYVAGASMRTLATQFGVHYQTVRAHLRRQGIDLRSDHPALLPRQIDEAVRLYAAGWSTYRLGERCGVDRSTVGKALKRAGVQMRSTSAIVI